MKYKEGTCFLVPLEDEGFSVGVIARTSKRGCAILTYHFAPRYEVAPALDDLAPLDPRMPILIARTGNLNLKSGRWPVLGTVDGWARYDWPMPLFLRTEPITNRRLAVSYSEEEPGKLVGEEIAPAGFHGPIDASWGVGAIESWLTVAITPESNDKGLDNPAVMTPWIAEGFITHRGITSSITVSVSAPKREGTGYVCEVDAGPALARIVEINGPNPERTRRNAMNILRVAVHERKVADQGGAILSIPVY
ncbi:Imm26 family immunity protein [Lysobacter sp. CA199]|uniref:Imm26 family immunity protein n=1 Tax=Lysobacter sp. CA199 TaxID=3455608 RepID=UPI003F8D4F52